MSDYVTMGTTAVAAGWYKDPSGSTALRWWDGTQWTDHLHQSVPTPAPQAQVAQPQFTPQPQVSVQPLAQPHIPHRGETIERPRNSSLVPGYYREDSATGFPGGSAQSAVAYAAPPTNNFVAWFSLATGLLSLATIAVAETIHGATYVWPFLGLTAIIFGIAALVRYRKRRVTVRWAPIVGIIAGGTSEVLLVAGIILAAVVIGTQGSNGTVAQGTAVGPTGAAINYDMGVGSTQYLPANNLNVGTAAAVETKLVGEMKLAYPSGSYPSELILHSNGDVTGSDGQDLGPLGLPNLHLGYDLLSSGAYELAISGANTSEAAIYISRLDEYFAACPADDTSCKTSSPVKPISVNGSDSDTTSSGPSTS